MTAQDVWVNAFCSLDKDLNEAFVILIKACPDLAGPLVREAFGATDHVRGSAIFPEDLGDQEKEFDPILSRGVAGNTFVLDGAPDDPYYIEAQLFPSTGFLRSLADYVARGATDALEAGVDMQEMRVPEQAILFLGASDAMPDELRFAFGSADRRESVGVRVLKVKDYTIERIFRRRLFALLPFYVFAHVDSMADCEQDEALRAGLVHAYDVIVDRLARAIENHVVSRYEASVISEVALLVLQHAASAYDLVREEVEVPLMRACELFHTCFSYKEGFRVGWVRGYRKGRLKALEKIAVNYYRKGELRLDEIATLHRVTQDRILKWAAEAEDGREPAHEDGQAPDDLS